MIEKSVITEQTTKSQNVEVTNHAERQSKFYLYLIGFMGVSNKIYRKRE